MKALRLLFLAAFTANTGLLTTFAQPLTPADHDKMLEILRKKMAEERAKSAPAPASPSVSEPTPAPAPAQPRPEPTVVPQPAPTDRAESPIVEHRLNVLRTALAKERGVDPAVLGVGVPSSESQAARSERLAKLLATAPKETPAPTASTSRPAPPPTQPAVVAPTESTPGAPAGPVTKQERLAALLLLYRSDQITPVEYHEQRSKIMAEP